MAILEVNLFDFGLILEDDYCTDNFGDIILIENNGMECGDWRYWEIDNFICQDQEIELDCHIGIELIEGNCIHSNCEMPEECLLIWLSE